MRHRGHAPPEHAYLPLIAPAAGAWPLEEAATMTVSGPALIPLARVVIALPPLASLRRKSLHSVHETALARRRHPWLSTAFPGRRHEALSAGLRPGGGHLRRMAHGIFADSAEVLDCG